MRLAGIEKGGYYPYPPHMAEATASWFIPLPAGTRARLLDPCAGEGEIASLLGKLLNCETWGCELFPYRAEKAAAHRILTLSTSISCLASLKAIMRTVSSTSTWVLPKMAITPCQPGLVFTRWISRCGIIPPTARHGNTCGG